MSLVKTKTNGDTFPTLFSDFFNTDNFFRPGWLNRELEKTVPAVNIKENAKNFNIELAVPGYKKEDFKIDLEGDMLNISAEKEDEKIDENERFTRKEYSYNSFSRSFTLPGNSEVEKIDAKYENGILKLVLPKKTEAKSASKKTVKID